MCHWLATQDRVSVRSMREVDAADIFDRTPASTIGKRDLN